jgi:hypothetical protein
VVASTSFFLIVSLRLCVLLPHGLPQAILNCFPVSTRLLLTGSLQWIAILLGTKVEEIWRAKIECVVKVLGNRFRRSIGREHRCFVLFDFILTSFQKVLQETRELRKCRVFIAVITRRERIQHLPRRFLAKTFSSSALVTSPGGR